MLDPIRIAAVAALTAWVGGTLLLSELRWFRRVSLSDRLLPFSGSRMRGTNRTLTTFREAFLPVASAVGERLAKALGVNDDLATRLRRASLDDDTEAFRTRQFTWAAASIGGGLIVIITVHPPALICALLVLGTPLLVFLSLEQQVAYAVQQRQQRLFAELPVMSEQLALLLSAGFSLGSALNRLADRNSGVIAHDLRQIVERLRHGLTTTQALREWAAMRDVVELHRLVAVLALSSETSDLGRLVSEEARSTRREAQRRLAETMDRRSQQVWIPVTVATLIPGVIFLTIPFLQALQLFSTN